MIKRSFLNPGAYVIFCKALKNDGLRWQDIGEIMRTSAAYPQSVVRGQANPKYNMVLETDIGFKEYFNEHEAYKRHLRKTLEVYETEDILDWFETHEDYSFLLHEFGYVHSTFEKFVLARLRDQNIKFLVVSELSWIIDEWESTSLGDFDLSNKQFYGIRKGVKNGS